MKQAIKPTVESMIGRNTILQYIAHTNANPQAFVWTKKAGQIIAKVNNCKAVLETLH